MRYNIFMAGILMILHSQNAFAQTFTSTSSYVRFYSEAPLENIEAINGEGRSAIDLSSGQIVFSIPIRGFQFAKSLMQEHFNENYMESEKYPKATFEGTLHGFEPEHTGSQKVRATGTMSIHGVEKTMEASGTLSLEDDTIVLKSQFPIAVAHYNIKIPKVVFYNIAEVVDVTVEFTYEKLEK